VRDVGKLAVLMVTAFVDMVGLLMVLPLLPFYAKALGGSGFVVGLLVSSFAIAQLIASPFWGRFSDRYGRRPALLIGLTASAIAFVVFAYASSLWLLFISRIVQGAGGGTVSVIQAYVADAVPPEDRAKGLGWLSAATNAGVALGPLLGSLAMAGGRTTPGLVAAAEARSVSRGRASGRHTSRRPAVPIDPDLRDRDRRLPGRERHPRTVPECALRRDREDHLLLLHVHRRDRRRHARSDPRARGGLFRRGAALTHWARAARRRPRFTHVHGSYSADEQRCLPALST